MAALLLHCRRVSAAPVLRRWTSTRSGLKYVASDEIDAQLLAGLTAPDEEERPVTLVQDRESANRVLRKLQELGPAHFHACDTEVAQIDIKAVGPVGNGKVQWTSDGMLRPSLL